MMDDRYRLAGFIACLLTILILAGIGGSAADLAIMTGVIALAGALLNVGGNRKVEIDQPKSEPVPVEAMRQPAPGVYERPESRA